MLDLTFLQSNTKEWSLYEMQSTNEQRLQFKKFYFKNQVYQISKATARYKDQNSKDSWTYQDNWNSRWFSLVCICPEFSRKTRF